MSKKWRNIVGIPLMGFAVASTIGVSSVAADYYASITNTTNGTTLASSLHTLSQNKHTTTLSYDDLWSAYATTDILPGTNIIWDIYSDYAYECGGTKQGANYSGEGDSYNREHTVPQSWFNENSPMVADCYHVYPTDGKVNGMRSNYPYGEVSSSTYTAQNGGKLGSSSISAYSNTVFEPIDEYKGDIARSYFYMAIRYSDKLSNWTSGEAQKIFKGSYPYLTNYALDLFAKWAHEDPVSDKEYIRNNAIAELQGNRNPFIDHPEWVDVIWSNSYTDSLTNTKYSASNVVAAVNNLSSSSSADDVYKAYAKYCRLNTSDKNSVTNAATLFSLVESKANTSVDLDTYWENIITVRGASTSVDQAKVDNVIALINAIPNPVSLSSEDSINAANTAYKALNNSEKALVTNYQTLQSALASLESLKSEARVQNVISLIDALPENPTSSDATQVNAAKTAYDALSNIEKAQITNYAKLQSALAAIAGGGVSASYVEVSSFDAVSADLNEYISYAAEQGSAGTAPAIYSNIIRVYQNGGTFTVTATGTVITALTLGSSMATTVTYSIDGGTESANQSIAANDKLTLTGLSASSVKFTCTGTSSSSRLYVNYLKVNYGVEEDTVDQEKVDNVISLINALPATITLSDEEAVTIADNAYEALSASEKALVTNYSALVSAKASLDSLMAYIKTFTETATKTSAKFSYSYETTGSGVEAYTLVTSASDLSAGDVIVITNSDATHALGTTQNTNNRKAEAITSSDSTITINSSVQLITLETGTTTGTFAFNVGTGYLYAASSSKNYLKTQSDIDLNASWSITITGGVASIIATDSSNHNVLSYNPNSGTPIFSAYSSVQQQIAIYRKTGGSTTTYSVSNAYIRFGAGMEKSTYEGLLDLGSTVKFGVSLSKDGTTYKDYECTPAYVAEIGAKNATPSGAFVQYSILIPVIEANYSTLIYAKSYVEIDGKKYYMTVANYSLHTLAQYYIQNADTLGITDSNVLGALGVF